MTPMAVAYQIRCHIRNECHRRDGTGAHRSCRLDILVNAAGIEIEKTIEYTTLEEWNAS